MLREDKDYFDKDYGMAPHGENFVLFTAEYCRLVQMRGYNITKEANVDKAHHVIETALADMNDYLSHDNMTAIVCLSKQFGLHYHEKYRHRDWMRRLHPRDIIFYLYAKGSVIGKILLPLSIISMLWAVFHKQITNGVLDTDGKLLTWLRIETFDLKKTRRMAEFILKWRHNKRWNDIFDIYFTDPNHPNRRHARRIYVDK